MTFGSASAIFQQAMLNPIMGRLWTTAAPTTFSSLSADTVKAALFNNTTTPDKTVAVGSTGFNTGVWITANEVTDVTNWVSGGRALASKAFTIDTGSSSICFQAAATAGGGNVTIANAYGCLVYDDTITAGTVAKQAMCYNSFGGSAQGVTAGTFTILWATVGALTNVVVFNVTV
jgi:hypothetical protein